MENKFLFLMVLRLWVTLSSFMNFLYCFYKGLSQQQNELKLYAFCIVTFTLSTLYFLFTLQPCIQMWHTGCHLNLQMAAGNLHIPLNIQHTPTAVIQIRIHSAGWGLFHLNVIIHVYQQSGNQN
jgi:hypothetical protein